MSEPSDQLLPFSSDQLLPFMGPSKEWKPKPANSNVAQGSVIASSSEVPTIVEANSQSHPALSDLDSKEATSELQRKLEESHISDVQHFIIPNHLQVPEADRIGFCFGSFDSSFDLSTSYSNDPGSENVPIPSKGTEDAMEQLSSNQTDYATGEEGDFPESPTHAPENLSSGEGDVSPSAVPEYDELKQETSLPPGNNQYSMGTADAIRRCLWVLEEYPVVEFLVLPGHHLYRMDYQKLIEAHRNNKADVTVAVLSISSSSLKDHDGPPSAFGVFKVNSENQVIEFKETKSISVGSSGVYNNINDHLFPSMGIYVINRETMKRLLTESFPKADELTSEVIPGALSLGMKVHAYRFDGYWEEMRSIEAFYQANMESTKKTNKGYKGGRGIERRDETNF